MPNSDEHHQVFWRLISTCTILFTRIWNAKEKVKRSSVLAPSRLPSIAHSRGKLSRLNPLAPQMRLHRADGHFLPVKDPCRQGCLGSGFLEHLGKMLHFTRAA